MIYSCALCDGEIAFGRFGLCQNCLKEWTVTGTFPVPAWLKTFMQEHHRNEQKKHNGELPFSHVFPSEEFAPAYLEVRYGIIEEKHRTVRRRGRPRKLMNARTPAK